MLDQARTTEEFIPPRFTPMPDDASFWKVARTTLSNPYQAVPASAYEKPALLSKRGAHLSIYLGDPDLVGEVLIRQAKSFPKSKIDYRVFGPSLGQGLLSADGEDWRWKRRLAAPTFTPAALAKLARDMAEPFEAVAENWRRGGAQEDEVDHAMVGGALAVIERILFSKGGAGELNGPLIANGIDELLKPMNWVILSVLLKFPDWAPFPGKLRQIRASRRIRAEVARVVQIRRAAIRSGDSVPQDLATALLKARDPETDRPLSDQDMVDMMLTLVAAGHETSAHSLSWALYCLAHQPDLQNRLAEEALALGDQPLDADAMDRLPKIEAAMKETLRLFPVAPMMGRVAAENVRLGEHDVPAGAFVVIPIHALHRHRLHWDRPDVFDGDRFLENPEPPRTLYMPFGGGPRICIGARLAMMEMTLDLAALLRKLRFAPCERTECDPLHVITLRPRNRLWLKIAPR